MDQHFRLASGRNYLEGFFSSTGNGTIKFISFDPSEWLKANREYFPIRLQHSMSLVLLQKFLRNGMGFVVWEWNFGALEIGRDSNSCNDWNTFVPRESQRRMFVNTTREQSNYLANSTKDGHQRIELICAHKWKTNFKSPLWLLFASNISILRNYLHWKLTSSNYSSLPPLISSFCPLTRVGVLMI